MKSLHFSAAILIPLFVSTVATAEELEDSNFHFQGTTITQGHPSINSPYFGTNSLSPEGETKTSLTSTLFLGHALWKDSEVHVNPEVSAGDGLSLTRGIAGFPNGEIYRVDTPSAKLDLSRIYLQQIVGLGGDKELIRDDRNQLSARVDQRRLTFILGKFSLNDYFDGNAYSHDPRTQFFNWALMDNGAWDYAADTRGYTWGVYAEYNHANWAVRFAFVLEPLVANGPELDPHFWEAYGANSEFEYRFQIDTRPGTVRLLSFANRAHMGSYRETLDNPSLGEDVTASRAYRTKFGFGVSFEQELASSLGGFMRLGWNNGTTESWNFTEIDRTIALGVSVRGSIWKRPRDGLGLAVIMNGLSKDHADYLSSGGYGFIIGDGHLNYAPEEIIETYYLYSLLDSLALTADFQYVNHPAYNADRGPAPIYSLRVHFEI